MAIRLICTYLESTMNRRDLLGAGVAAVAGLIPSRKTALDRDEKRDGPKKIPLIHITDLYHPPQDPDDHVDLATVAALDEYDLRGIVLDVTRKFLLASPAGFDKQRDPGFIPVVQLGYLQGRSIPVACGPTLPLTHSHDDLRDRSQTEQAGVHLLLNILEECREQAVISVVGSARALTAAYNRNPGLLKESVRAVLLNAGSTGGTKREWNVGLDPEAYVGLWQSGLPIYWYPCATERGAFNPDDERGTYWKTNQEILFRDLAPPVRAWFEYALTNDTRGDVIGALTDAETSDRWEGILSEQRHMWATASLVMEAGRILAQTSLGWRFIPAASTVDVRYWRWHLDRIEASVNEKAEVSWQTVKEGGNAMLFSREKGAAFGSAMAEALGALLATLPAKS